MEYVKFGLELAVAFFSVLGLYGMICRIAQKLFAPKNWLIAVEILTQQDVQQSESLIRDALFGSLSFPSKRVVVLTKREFMICPALLKTVQTYNIPCYCMEDEG